MVKKESNNEDEENDDKLVSVTRFGLDSPLMDCNDGFSHLGGKNFDKRVVGLLLANFKSDEATMLEKYFETTVVPHTPILAKEMEGLKLIKVDFVVSVLEVTSWTQFSSILSLESDSTIAKEDWPFELLRNELTHLGYGCILMDTRQGTSILFTHYLYVGATKNQMVLSLVRIHDETLELLNLDGCKKVIDAIMEAIADNCFLLNDLDVSKYALTDYSLDVFILWSESKIAETGFMIELRVPQSSPYILDEFKAWLFDYFIVIDASKSKGSVYELKRKPDKEELDVSDLFLTSGMIPKKLAPTLLKHREEHDSYVKIWNLDKVGKIQFYEDMVTMYDREVRKNREYSAQNEIEPFKVAAIGYQGFLPDTYSFVLKETVGATPSLLLEELADMVVSIYLPFECSKAKGIILTRSKY
ncbi:hypothetical protein K7X08_002769 [Anisodus acutangulus]|uniref:Uncharacterized protein n=1 Tax=Anisodus acutangulus TaxID=402998 RepID=A0A9Q1RHL5_9SOLA|nr:hypothetical protein K7X08_002769 [Anisodus acutangulus]